MDYIYDSLITYVLSIWNIYQTQMLLNIYVPLLLVIFIELICGERRLFYGLEQIYEVLTQKLRICINDSVKHVILQKIILIFSN